MDVRPIDPHDAADFESWFNVLHLTDLERWPDEPGWQREERLAWALNRDGPEEHRCLVAAGSDGQVLGIADLEMFRRENLHLARLEVRVLPQARRQGIGRAIVNAAARMAHEAGRTELGGMDETPLRPDYVDAVKPFAEGLGFAPAMGMNRRQLAVPLTARQVAAFLRSPKAAPAGYSMVTFADRWPDEFLADRCELGRRMSTDIPTGDQRLDEEVWDENRVRQIEASLVAQNRAKVITAARHDGTGKLVAFTEVVIPRAAPESSWQHDTLVVREHRGHSLGFAIKLANLLAVTESFPAVRAVNTWNAVDNDHMIAINDEMGFRVVSSSVYWLKDIGKE